MLNTKRILITGITGNLGQAAAKLFFKEGWDFHGVSRQKSVESFDPPIWNTRLGLDLMDWAATGRYIAKSDPFDIVFMTHGVQIPAKLEEMDRSLWQNIIGNNLESALNLTVQLKRYGKVNPGGLIVYCSSIQATQPREGRGLYAIAKAGLEALVRIAAVEFAPEVRTVGLRLGQMESQMKNVTFDAQAAAEIKEYTPLPWVSFEETARLVLALYGQSSLTGEIIEMSSGHKFSIWPKGKNT